MEKLYSHVSITKTKVDTLNPISPVVVTKLSLLNPRFPRKKKECSNIQFFECDKCSYLQNYCPLVVTNHDQCHFFPDLPSKPLQI